MFSGPYMILEVNHNIAPGMFDTTIKGVRQPTAALPKVDQFIQTLKTNLIKKIQDRLKQETDSTQTTATNVKSQTQESYENINNNPANSFSQNQTCSANTKYSQYLKEEPAKSTATPKEVKEAVLRLCSSAITNDPDRLVILTQLVFAKLYMSTFTTPNFETYNNNYSGIDISGDWGGSANYFKVDSNGNGLYYCSSGNKPFASFNNLDDSINLLVQRWAPRITPNLVDVDEYEKFVVLNSEAKQLEPNVWNEMSDAQKENIRTEMGSALSLLEET
jgi:hypothetical protein